MNWSDVDVESISFPPDFLWGAATAAHQVEGGLHNNWSVFEESRGLEKSGEACDHWNRWEEDFEMLSELCLLYTSPSPRDATLSRMPSSA